VDRWFPHAGRSLNALGSAFCSPMALLTPQAGGQCWPCPWAGPWAVSGPGAGGGRRVLLRLRGRCRLKQQVAVVGEVSRVPVSSGGPDRGAVLRRGWRFLGWGVVGVVALVSAQSPLPSTYPSRGGRGVGRAAQPASARAVPGRPRILGGGG